MAGKNVSWDDANRAIVILKSLVRLRGSDRDRLELQVIEQHIEDLRDVSAQYYNLIEDIRGPAETPVPDC